jgi:predicted lactoylglutathione lyase
MDQRVSILTLGVADLARSRAFYERLGWRASSVSNDSITFFQAGGLILALYSRAELAKDANLAPESQGFPGFTVSFNARTRSEVDKVLREAEKAGAKILKPAQEAFWGGYSGYFADPDSFIWEVAFNPSFPIDPDDGTIQLPE